MKKIMFNDKYGLTKAVLEGRKTMTRRIIKAPKMMEGKEVYGFAVVRRPGSNDVIEIYATDADGAQINNILPAFKVGEVVAVAQPYKDVIYTGGYPHPIVSKPGWSNKMFVRADLMPHQIRITNVRVERLQDISDEDCLREGVQAVRIPKGCVYVAGGATIHDDARKRIESCEIELSEKCSFDTPRDAFAILIDKVSGKGTWESNPWVYVYEFELVK